MIISIDYDDTYTRDPLFWNWVCDKAMERGHEVWCVSARHPRWMDEPEQTIGRVIGAERCVGTSGAAKKDFLWEKHGVLAHVWIDDMPESVMHGLEIGGAGLLLSRANNP